MENNAMMPDELKLEEGTQPLKKKKSWKKFVIIGVIVIAVMVVLLFLFGYIVLPNLLGWAIDMLESAPMR